MSLRFIVILVGNRLLNLLSIWIPASWKGVHARLTSWKCMIVYRFATPITYIRPWTTKHDYMTVEAFEQSDWYPMIMPGDFSKDTRDYPPVEDVVQSLFARETYKEDPKTTMLFAAFASWVVASLLQTNLTDQRRSHTDQSLYIRALYGKLGANRDSLRTMRGGKLKSQVIQGEELSPYAEETGPGGRAKFLIGNDRMNMNPLMLVFNTIFLREHNRIAGDLAALNPAWDDTRLFETTRIIITLICLRAILEVYIDTLNQVKFQFSIAAFKKVQSTARSVEMAKLPPIEYELSYIWHGLIPDNVSLAGADVPFVSFYNRPDRFAAYSIDTWIESLSRQKSGLQRTNNNPEYLLPIDILKMKLARELGIRSLNDYRECLGYSRHKTFADVTKDKAVQAKLKKLYGSVDRVEFYPGVYAEEPISGFKGMVMTDIISTNSFIRLGMHPLLNEHVMTAENVTEYGMELLGRSSLKEVILRNTKTNPAVAFEVA